MNEQAIASAKPTNIDNTGANDAEFDQLTHRYKFEQLTRKYLLRC